MQSAGITLLKSDLRGIAKAICLNLFFAFAYNALGIPIAAGLLYPFLRPAAQSHARGSSDEPELCFGQHECAALATAATVNAWKYLHTISAGKRFAQRSASLARHGVNAPYHPAGIRA